MPEYSRGDVYTVYQDGVTVTVEILGGPTAIGGRGGTMRALTRFYTVRVIEDSEGHWKTLQTILLSSTDLKDFRCLGPSYANVIEKHCPNCDEPDMIFYDGDYICAWCRENLEDICGHPHCDRCGEVCGLTPSHNGPHEWDQE